MLHQVSYGMHMLILVPAYLKDSHHRFLKGPHRQVKSLCSYVCESYGHTDISASYFVQPFPNPIRYSDKIIVVEGSEFGHAFMVCM